MIEVCHCEPVTDVTGVAIPSECQNASGEAQGEPLRSDVGFWNDRGIATPACALVRNDMRLTGLVRNDRGSI